MVHSVLTLTGAENGDSCSNDVVVVPEPYATFGHVFDCADMDDAYLEGLYYVECATPTWVAEFQPMPECTTTVSATAAMYKCNKPAKQSAWVSGDADNFDAAITGDDCAWQSTILDCFEPMTTSTLDADRGAFLERLLSREASPFLSEVSGTSDSDSVFDGEETRPLVGDKRGFLNIDFVDPCAAPEPAAAASPACKKRRKCDVQLPTLPPSEPSSVRTASPIMPHSVSGSRSSSPMTEGDEGSGGLKRNTHNFLERCRRKDIKTNYRILQSQVPAIADVERIPTGQILLHAVELIKQLQEEDMRMEAQIAQLKQDNASLRCKLHTA